MNQDLLSKAIHEGEIEGYHGSWQRIMSIHDLDRNHKATYTRGYGLYLVTEEDKKYARSHGWLHRVKARGRIANFNTEEGLSLFFAQQGELLKRGDSRNVYDSLHEDYNIDILVTNKTHIVVKNLDSILEVECVD